MAGEFKRTLEVNINTNVNTQKIQDAEKVISKFFDKHDGESLKIGIDTKKAKVDVADFTKTILKIKDLTEEVNSVKKNSPAMLPSIKTDIDFLEKVKNEMSSVFAVFNDKSSVSGLDNIMSKISNGFSVVAVDLGERVQYLKNQIFDIVEAIDRVGGINKDTDGYVWSFKKGDMSSSDLQNRIDLLSSLVEYQKELEKFNGSEFKSKNAPTGMTTQKLNYNIKNLKGDLQELENYNSQVEEQYRITTAQLERRRQLINQANYGLDWSLDEQDIAKRNIKDDEYYERSINTLKEYITEKEHLIERFQNSEAELFRADGIEQYVSRVQEQITEYRNFINEIENLRKNNGKDAPIVGDFSEVVEQLKEIKNVINEIKSEFKPLTDAFADGNSALSKMLSASVEDLTKLETKLSEVYSMIDTISTKDFSTNINQIFDIKGSGKKTEIEQLDLYQQKAKETVRLIYEMNHMIASSKAYGNTFRSGNGKMTQYTELFTVLGSGKNMFDVLKLNKDISGASTLQQIKKIIGGLEVYKKAILEAADAVNKSIPNSIDTSIFSSLDEYDSRIAKASETATDTANKIKEKLKQTNTNQSAQSQDIGIKTESMIGDIKTLSGQIETELTSIRSMMEETFNFDTLDLKSESLKSTIGAIYQQFVELQDKIKALDFSVPITAAQADSNVVKQSELFDTVRKETIHENPLASHDNNVATKNATQDAEQLREAYDNASAKVDVLREKLSEAASEQENLEKHAKFYGYTLDMSAMRSGRVQKTLDAKGRAQYVVDELKAGRSVIKTDSGEYGFDRSDLGKGVYTKITKTEYDYAQYLSSKIAELNVGWEEGLKILASQNGQLDVARQKVSQLEAELSDAVQQAEVAYERMAYASHGIFGDDKIAADKKRLEEQSKPEEITAESVKEITNEAQAIQDVAVEADKAAEAKEKFANANKEVAKTAEKTSQEVEKEAKKMEEAAGAIVEASDKFDKTKKVLVNDELKSTTTTKTNVRENAIETKSITKRYDQDRNVISETETIVNDFRKRAAELKKEAAKIELAKKTVDKFLSQFNNKTAGHGKDIAGYASLETFEIKSLDDIDKAMQKMIELDTVYNELTRDFRKGTKSMNPFVNAFNSMDEMSNKVKKIQLDFKSLKFPTNELKNQVSELPELLNELDKALKPDEKGAINITNIAKAYGNLNETIKKVSSSIGLQRKEERMKAASSKIEESQIKSLHQLYEQQSKSAAKISEYRQKLNSEGLGAEESRLIAAQLHQEKEKFASIQQQIRAYGDLYNSVEQVATITHELYMAEVKRGAIKEQEVTKTKEKELNDLYKERSVVITRIIQLSKKLQTLKTDNAKKRAREALEGEKENLRNIDKQINQHGKLVDRKKLEKQDTRLKNNQIDTSINSAEEDLKVYNNILKTQEKLYNLKKKMVGLDPQSAEGQEMLRKLTEAQKEYNDALKQKYRLTKTQRNSVNTVKAQQESELGSLQQEHKSKISTEQEEKDLKYVLSLYKQYTDAALSLKKMQTNTDVTGAVHTDKQVTAIKEIQEAKKNLLALGIDINKIADSELLTEKQINALLEEQSKYKKEIQNIENAANDKIATKASKQAQKENKQNQNYGKTIYNRETRYFDTIEAKERALGASEGLSDGFIEKIEKYKTAFKELQDLREQFAENPNAFNNNALKTQFQDAAIEVENLRKEILNTFKESQKFASISSDLMLGKQKFDPTQFTSAKSAMIDFASTITDGQFKFKGFNDAGTEMYGTLNKGAGVIQKVTVALDEGTNSLYAYQSGTMQATKSWNKFGGFLKSKVASLVTMYLSMYDMIRYFRKGVSYVKEIDIAMTELKKVTNETEQAYDSFLNTMVSYGREVSATVSELTTSAADWARLNI